ncbi:MAG: aminotransferase class V-fold PLP-dependent enzyme [Cetobacterium sp.]
MPKKIIPANKSNKYKSSKKKSVKRSIKISQKKTAQSKIVKIKKNKNGSINCSLNAIDSMNIKIPENSSKESKKNIIKEILNVCGASADYNVYFYESQYEIYSSLIFTIVKAFTKITNIPNVICSTMEHPYIIEILEKYKQDSMITITYVKSNIHGSTLVSEVKQHIQKDTCLIIVSHVNFITGVINNIKQLSNLAHEHRVPLFSDCIYSFGRLNININDMNVDVATLNFGSFKDQVLLIKRDLVEGFDLANESPKFQINMNKIKIFDEAKANYISDVIREVSSRTSISKINKIHELRKYFIDRLPNKHYYEEIVKNNLVPKTKDIIIIGHNTDTKQTMPHIL